MGSVREPDPMATYLVAQQQRVLEYLASFVSGGGASALSTVRTIVRALRDGETEVLYPALSRLQLPAEIELLLADSRDSRAHQLDALDALAHKRGSRARKLAAIELADQVQHHFQQHMCELIPALASRVPRALYRSVAARFVARCQDGLDGLGRRAPARSDERRAHE